MPDLAQLEEKIKKTRKVLSEKKTAGEGKTDPEDARGVRKRLKRLQRRRRAVLAWNKRTQPAKPKEEEGKAVEGKAEASPA